MAYCYPTHELGVEAEELEQRRIMDRRARDEERRLRWQTGKMVGARLSSLDEQVRDCETKKNLERAADLEYASRCESVQLAVDAQRQQADEIRRAEMRAIKEDWDAASRLPKNNAAKRGGIQDSCRLLRFAGEDESRALRISAQQRQMHKWTTDRVEARRARKISEEEEEKRMAAWEAHVLERRKLIEEKEKEVKAARARDLGQEHVATAAAKASERLAKKREKDVCDDLEIQRNLADPLLTEDTSTIYEDGRVRKDHFKGFTKGQISQIYRENKDLEESHLAQQAEFKREEDAYAKQLEEMTFALDKAEFEKYRQQQNKLRAVNKDQETLRAEQARIKLLQKQGAFGAIADGGILHGFGQSCR